MTPTRTPGPWRVCPTQSAAHNWLYIQGGEHHVNVADVLHCSSLEERNANAAFIVSACNAHEELVEALEMAQACLGDIVRAGIPSIDEVETYSAVNNALALARRKE